MKIKWVRAPVDLAIENAIAYYPSLFSSRTEVLHHMFIVLGCGYEWSKGELVVLREGNERDRIRRTTAKRLAQRRTKIANPYPWSSLCNLAIMPGNVKIEWRAAAEEIRSALINQQYKFEEEYAKPNPVE